MLRRKSVSSPTRAARRSRTTARSSRCDCSNGSRVMTHCPYPKWNPIASARSAVCEIIPECSSAHLEKEQINAKSVRACGTEHDRSRKSQSLLQQALQREDGERADGAGP